MYVCGSDEITICVQHPARFRTIQILYLLARSFTPHRHVHSHQPVVRTGETGPQIPIAAREALGAGSEGLRRRHSTSVMVLGERPLAQPRIEVPPAGEPGNAAQFRPKQQHA